MASGETYAIIPSTFQKGTEFKFFLNIFAKKRIVVKEPVSEELTGRTIKVSDHYHIRKISSHFPMCAGEVGQRSDSGRLC